MYVHPENFPTALAFFRYSFEIWVQGYRKWGDQDFQATFVKDPTVPRGIIMYCQHGERELAQAIEIIEPPKRKPPKSGIEG